MKKISWIALLLFSCVTPNLFAAADYIETFGKTAKVNWTKGEACATGLGIVKTSQWSTEQKIEAHRAATLDAMRQLVDVVNNIHVDSKTKVGDISNGNGIVKKRISGMVKNFTEREVRFQKDGTCEVDVAIPLNGDGSIADIILGDIQLPQAGDFQADPVNTVSLNPTVAKIESEAPSTPLENTVTTAPVETKASPSGTDLSSTPFLQKLTETPKETPSTGEKENSDKILKVYQKKDPVLLVQNTTPVGENEVSGFGQADSLLKEKQKEAPVMLAKNTPPVEEPAIPSKESTSGPVSPTGNISGLVVNISGERVRPALSPKIITEKGSEVYGFNQADRDFRKINGLASYATDIGDAKLDKRVTENPFVVDAVKVDNESPCTIVIREEDADKFMKLDGSDRILKRCRVIIVSKDEQYQDAPTATA